MLLMLAAGCQKRLETQGVDELDASASDGRPPVLNFEPSRLEFGKVAPSQILRSSTKATNTSSAVVTIDHIAQSCSCTVVGLATPFNINPGETVEVPIQTTISPQPSDDEHATAVTLYVSQPVAAEYVLEVHATIERPPRLIVDPPTIIFGRFGSWESLSKVVHVSSSTQMRPANVKVESDSHYCAVDHVASADERELAYKVTLATGIPEGPFRSNVRLSSPEADSSLTITGQKCNSWFAESDTVVFAIQADGWSSRKALRFHHPPSSGPTEVVELSSDLGHFEVTSSTVVSPDVISIEGRLRADRKRLSSRGSVWVKTQDKRQLVLQAFISGPTAVRDGQVARKYAVK